MIYTYDVSAETLAELEAFTQFILDDELLESQGRRPPDWYYAPRVEQPYRQGTLDEVSNFNRAIIAAGLGGALIGGAPIVRVDAQTTLLSQSYRVDLQSQIEQNYESVRSLSNTTGAQVIQQVRLGVDAGLPPSEISANIQARFAVAASSADRIARTETNWAFNNAKIAEVDRAARETGFKPAVLHLSALTSTTRATHAARHGNAYTPAAQQQWWNSGANRINCLCTTQTVLVDRSGNILGKDQQEEIKAERAFFDEPTVRATRPRRTPGG